MRVLLRTPVLVSVLTVATAAGVESRPLEIGQPVPDFQATSLQGEAVALDAAVPAHRAVVVLFLSTVCPYARYFASHLRDLAAAYGPQGVFFVGINSNNWETPDEVSEDARARGFTFPMVKDERHVIADRLGATRTPEAFLVDSAGRLRYRGWVKSKMGSPDLQRALDAVLNGRPVPRPITKAFGCAVDRF